MFLLAHLHITDLARQMSKTQLLHALKKLPKEVTATYADTFKSIRQRGENEKRPAFHALSWILYTMRPLSLGKLRHVLAIHDLGRMAERFRRCGWSHIAQPYHTVPEFGAAQHTPCVPQCHPELVSQSYTNTTH